MTADMFLVSGVGLGVVGVAAVVILGWLEYRAAQRDKAAWDKWMKTR